MSQSYFLAFFFLPVCVWGGAAAVITISSPAWQSSCLKYCSDKNRRNRPPSRPLSFEEGPFRAPFPRRETKVGSPSPIRESGPRGQRLRGEKQRRRRRRGLKGTAPRARASPIRRRRPRSRERAEARGLRPRSCGACTALPVGPRRGWGRGGPRFVWSQGSCHPAPTLVHDCTISPFTRAAPQQGPSQPPPCPRPTAELGARSLPASSGAQSILTPTTRKIESKPRTSPLRCSGPRILQSLPPARFSSATSEGRGRGQLRWGGGGGTAHALAARGPPGTRPAGGGARAAHRSLRGARGSPEGGGRQAGRRRLLSLKARQSRAPPTSPGARGPGCSTAGFFKHHLLLGAGSQGFWHWGLYLDYKSFWEGPSEEPPWDR